MGNSAGNRNRDQLDDADNQQRIADREGVRNGKSQDDEEPAAEETAQVERKFVDEDVGVGVAVFAAAHAVDHAQLEREVAQIHQRPTEHEAEHEDNHPRGRVERGIEGPAEGEEQQTGGEDRHAVVRGGEAPQQVEQHGRDDGADGLQRAERRLVAHERHHEHRGGRNDIALGDALQHGEAHHPPPEGVEAPEEEAIVLRLGEAAPHDDRRGDDRQHEDEERNELIGEVDVARKPAVVGRGAKEGADHARHDDAGHRIEEALQPVVVVAVAVVGRGQGQEVAVGPEESVREAHDEAREDDSAQFERLERHHHRHRDAAQQHAERVEVRDADAAHEESVDEERDRDARVDGQLVAHDVGELRAVAHDVGADEELDDRKDEGVEHVRQEQNPHVERIGAEVSEFRQGPVEHSVLRPGGGGFFHVSSLVSHNKDSIPPAAGSTLLYPFRMVT